MSVIVSKFFICVISCWQWFIFPEKFLFWFNTEKYRKKTLLTDWRGYITNINFWCKANLESSTYRKLLNLKLSCDLFCLISIKSLKNIWKLFKNLRYRSLKEIGASYEQIFGFTDNAWQKFCRKPKNLVYWTRPESFDVCFCVSFPCFWQKSVFGGKAER